MPFENMNLSAVYNADEDFQLFMIFILIFIILAIYIIYMIYLTSLKTSNSKFMIEELYPSLDGYIKPISENDSDCSGNLFDYYVKTAYNACSGGSYKNDFVDIDCLKAVLKQGVRCVDFEIYSIDNKPVVATSTSESYFIKETFNSVDFASVMDTINSYAFSGGTSPNPTDPLIIHLRIKSNNQAMYTKLADIFKSYDNITLGEDYSYENHGHNLGNIPLLSFQGKVILIVDKTNNSFLENEAFLEFVNLTSNSIFMRSYTNYDIVNNPDIQELTEYNKTAMTIVLPDVGISPANPSAILARTFGCQFVAMRYQLVDNFLMESTQFFDSCSYAFCLKPANLRYEPVTVPDPTPQNPAYSYATRTTSTDFYSFKS
jgi:hypothetical protein